MDAEERPLLPDLAAALGGWRKRGRLGDLVPHLLGWCIARFGAERAMLFSEDSDGGYRVWGSRTIDGPAVPDADKSIAHFAVMRAAGSETPTLFPDTRSDRRFRTEAEMQRGVRSRSILIIPVVESDPAIAIYLDSRFRVIDEPEEADLEWVIVRDVLALALTQAAEHRALRDLRKRWRRREKEQVARVADSEGAEGEVARAARAEKPTPAARPAVDPIDFHGFLTRHRPLIDELDELKRLAPSDVPILLEGESGTGKELLARGVHLESGRHGRFLTLHCATITETLVEVELFGHHEGAFTGADRAREGLLAHAEGGTLFLDAVEEASPTLQGALLRVLETGQYRPLGAEEEVAADVRIISALLSSPDLESGTSEVRSDLFYRLAGARVFLPPLRERREDIIPIMGQLLTRQARGGESPRWEEGVEEALLVHDWPGNAREMWNLALKLGALGESTLTEERFRAISGVTRVAPKVEGTMRGEIDRVEREGILRALHEAGGNKTKAAQILGWSRRTFYRRMEKHGIPLA